MTPWRLPLAELVARVASARPWQRLSCGLAPRAAFAGFPDDVPLRGFDPERHLLENALALPGLMAQNEAQAQAPRHRRRDDRGPRSHRPPTEASEIKKTAAQRRQGPPDKPPTWRGAVNRAAIAAVVFAVIAACCWTADPAASALLAVMAFCMYVPSGYYIDKLVYERRQKRKQQPSSGSLTPMDVRMFTVGPVMENSFLFRREGSDRALIVDPARRRRSSLGRSSNWRAARRDPADAYPLRPRRRGRAGGEGDRRRGVGAEIERPVLADIMSFVPWPGFGPFESYDAEHTLAGGEKLELAGFEIDVIFTPGHSPGHVTFSIPDEQVVFSGDVLFQGSVGRTDLPGGDWPTLLDRSAAWWTPCRARPRSTRPHGRDDARRERATQPVPGGAGPLSLQAPKGTFDVLPEDAPARLRLLQPLSSWHAARRRLRVSSPIFEDTELFARGVGESTDIVQKEMFTFEDMGGRSLTLRPEGTARSAARTSSTACTSARSR